MYYEDYEGMSIREWAPKESGLIAWFFDAKSNGKLPAKPFSMSPHMFVVDPEKFYKMLCEGCGTCRAESLRAIRGVLEKDLGDLYFFVNGKEFSLETRVEPLLFEDVEPGSEGKKEEEGTALFDMPLPFE